MDIIPTFLHILVDFFLNYCCQHTYWPSETKKSEIFSLEIVDLSTQTEIMGEKTDHIELMVQNRKIMKKGSF